MKNILVPLVLFEILLLSFFLRFWNLDISPRWYVDEGAYTDVARNLALGMMRNEALRCDFFQRSLPHPPLMFIAAAVLMKGAGDHLAMLRLVAAASGLFTTFLMYLLGKELADEKTGLLAAFIFTIHPLSVVFNRMGFPYNPAMLLAVAAFYFFIKYKKSKKAGWLHAASLATGLSLITSYHAVGLFLFLAIATFLEDRKRLPSVFVLSLGFLLIFMSLMFIFHGNDFLRDVSQVFSGRGGEDPGTLALVPETYLRLISTDYLIFTGFLGLILFKFRHRELLILVFLLTSFLIVKQSGPPISTFFYRAVFFAPFLLLGSAIFFMRLPEKLANAVQSEWKKPFKNLLGLTIAISLLFIAMKDIKGARNGYTNGMDPWAVESIEDTEVTAFFINYNTEAEDFVMAPRYFYWLLRCAYTDFLQPIAFKGQSTNLYPEEIDKNRFYFDPAYQNAKYIVLSNNLERWAINQPGVKELVENMAKKEKWPVVFARGEYSVLQNPRTIHESTK